jgi:ABC-type sugar transport system permease subunit
LYDPLFYGALKNNAILIGVVIPILVIICLVFSVLLYGQGKYGKAFQLIVFLPYALSITVTGIMFSYLLQLNGVVNEVLRRIGLGFFALDWLGSPKIAIFTITAIIIWKEIGFGTILFLSRLGTLSEELIDASRIDGANWWQQVWYIYIPHLKGIMLFYVTLLLTLMMSWVFNYVYVTTGGGSDTMVFEFYVYKQIFTYNNKWVGSAASIMVFTIITIVIFFQMRSRLGLAEEEL